MSTYVDFQFKFSGPEDEIVASEKFILALRSEHDLEDDSSEPKVQADGSLWWSGYATGGLAQMNRSVANFTRGNSLQAWCYLGSTDGCCEGELWLFEKGSDNLAGRWDADIGLRSAVAACALADSPDEASAIQLVKRVALASSDGWNAVDWTHLLAGGVCFQLLANAVRVHPSLVSSARLRCELLKNANAFAEVRNCLRKYRAMKKKLLVDIDGLYATIESLELGAVVAAEEGAARDQVRL